MFIVGLAEIAIALICFLSKRRTLALGLGAWISANFVVYRSRSTNFSLSAFFEG